MEIRRTPSDEEAQRAKIAAILEAIREADAGEFASEEELHAVRKKWEVRTAE